MAHVHHAIHHAFITFRQTVSAVTLAFTVNLLANATSPNAGGVLALVGTPMVSNGTFSQVGSSLTGIPTPGFVGAMVARYAVGDGKAVNAGGATDSLGRVITYTATGLPAGLVINSSTGVISGIHDSSGPETFTIAVTATPAGGTHPLVRSSTLTILDQG